MFQETQDQEYLDLCKNRLYSKQSLIWTNQVVNIIRSANLAPESKISDIGCNVGHFYKTLARWGPNSEEVIHMDYYGYDVESQYIDIARERFPKGKFFMKNIENEPIPSTDVLVCSATLEHLQYPIDTLKYLLSKTGKLVILRTLVGETSQTHLRMKKMAKAPYVIHQFSFLELLSAMEFYKFHTEVIRDEATDSMPKYIDNGIIRTQYIIVGRKNLP
jgi:trans-aconitate methyltransferase